MGHQLSKLNDTPGRPGLIDMESGKAEIVKRLHKTQLERHGAWMGAKDEGRTKRKDTRSALDRRRKCYYWDNIQHADFVHFSTQCTTRDGKWRSESLSPPQAGKFEQKISDNAPTLGYNNWAFCFSWILIEWCSTRFFFGFPAFYCLFFSIFIDFDWATC